jgi:hypothetical protein
MGKNNIVNVVQKPVFQQNLPGLPGFDISSHAAFGYFCRMVFSFFASYGTSQRQSIKVRQGIVVTLWQAVLIFTEPERRRCCIYRMILRTTGLYSSGNSAGCSILLS